MKRSYKAPGDENGFEINSVTVKLILIENDKKSKNMKESLTASRNTIHLTRNLEIYRVWPITRLNSLTIDFLARPSV